MQALCAANLRFKGKKERQGKERLRTKAAVPACRIPSSYFVHIISRFRDDLQALRAGDLAEAQRLKEVMEVAQRKDKRLREAGRG